MKKLRLIGSLAVVAAILVFVVLVPLPHTVLCAVELKAHGATPVYVEVPGTLQTLQVQAGRRVEAGTLLAQLESADLDLEIALLERQRDEQAAQYQVLSRLRFSDRQALSQMPQAHEALRSAEEQLSKRLADRRRWPREPPATAGSCPRRSGPSSRRGQRSRVCPAGAARR